MAGTYRAQIAMPAALSAGVGQSAYEAGYEPLHVIHAVSPTVTAERIEGGVEITVHDLSGTDTVTLYDGEDGRGVESVALNADYTLTITFTDGTSYTTPNIRGEKGETGATGATGNGIASITLNQDYTLTITYTNGQSVTTASIRGPQGEAGEDGTDGADGYSPTVAVAAIAGGHRVTITDASGDHVFDILDGTDGQDGQDGQDGAPGQDGDDGYSPTVAITTITGGHRVTITDANGDHSFDILDGATGQTGDTGPAGPGLPSGGTVGQITRKRSGTDYDTEWGDESVSDVQVNGVSILSGGVANINVADSGQIRGGASSTYPLAPIRQHESVFYGLTKAAGVDMASSSNAVGTYTDAAKAAIQAMIGVPTMAEIITAVHDSYPAAEEATF